MVALSAMLDSTFRTVSPTLFILITRMVALSAMLESMFPDSVANVYRLDKAIIVFVKVIKSAILGDSFVDVWRSPSLIPL